MKIIRMAQPIEEEQEISSEILYQGHKDPEITGYVHPEKDLFRVPIKDGEKVVGFFTPRKDGNEWRVGAIFVLPEHRGKGLAGKALEGFFTGDKLPAYAQVGTDNYSSEKAFESAGFVAGEDIRVDESGWKSRRWTKVK